MTNKSRCENEIIEAYKNRKHGILPGSFSVQLSKRAENYIKENQKGHESYNDTIVRISQAELIYIHALQNYI